jgi:predicted nucleic acid-binding protein
VAASITPRVYLDADVYLHVLGDQEHADVCMDLLEAAERGDIQLIASRLLSAEVGSYKGNMPGEKAADEMIARFLDGVGVEWVELDVIVAREARMLSWKYELRAGDAVHLATAVRRHADYLMSFDEKFPFGQTVSGVSVMKPDRVWQPSLFDNGALEKPTAS